jgi:hypothetical protein
MEQCVWHHVLSRLTGFEVRTIICTCSAITHADFLRFFDDFGADALSLIRAKLQNTSFEVVVDGVYQQHRSLQCLRIRNATLRTLDDIRQLCVRACVPLAVSG